MGVSTNYWPLVRSPCNQDLGILGPILGSPPSYGNPSYEPCTRLVIRRLCPLYVRSVDHSSFESKWDASVGTTSHLLIIEAAVRSKAQIYRRRWGPDMLTELEYGLNEGINPISYSESL